LTRRFVKTKWEGMFSEEDKASMSKQLKPNEFLVLMSIAMTQDHNGYSDITIKQIMGCVPIGSNKTVNVAIEGLLEFRYEGKPVIEKHKKVGFKGKEQNVYKLLPNPLFAVYGEETLSVNNTHNEIPLSVNSTLHDQSLSVNSTHTKETSITKEKDIKRIGEDESMKNEKMTNKEIVSHFKGLLEEKGITKKPNYPRLMKQMKTIEPLFKNLINNEIKKVLVIVVENYESWSSPQYPLEVGVVARKWVIERAIKELDKEKQEESQIQEQTVEATKRQSKAIDSIMSRIKKKGGQ
jgi:hypothetical protein